MFVVPGDDIGPEDDPAKVKTSYELVRSDEKEGVWVLRTPVLPDGKRLEAVYQADRKSASRRHFNAEVKQVP